MLPHHIRLIIVSIVCFLIVLFVCIIRFVEAPALFPQYSVVIIVPGENLNDVTRTFRNSDIVRSSITFQSLVILFGGEHKVIAGDYLLSKPESALELAWRVVHGKFDMVEVKITIPEGFTNKQIGDVLEQKLTMFDEQQFLTLAKPDEGYLFPDTYFFVPTATSSQIITLMQENFTQKLMPLLPAIATSTHSESDIITMASILESEATSTTDRQIVAGILWKRLANGQPLDVDSTVAFAAGSTLPDLTTHDLTIKSPYNTYLHNGLPPGPIDNPGLDSIQAALHPLATAYNYYLTGNDGVMHYATTYADHEANIAKYLK